MGPATLNLVEHWYRALESAEGIWLRTPHPQRLITSLYTARSRHNDPRLASLSLQASRRDPTGEVWIIKNLGSKP